MNPYVGIRWTLSQLIMQKSQLGLSNPIDMIYHVQPVMIIVLLPFAIAFEGVKISSSLALFRFEDSILFVATISRVVTGGLIAFFMEVAEYLLVSYTSGLTLSVAGIVKEILSLGLAILIEATDISAINAVGLVVCMAGITLHVIRKATMADKRTTSSTNNGRSLGRGGGAKGGGVASSMRLLSDSDSDSETELFHTSSGAPRPSRQKQTEVMFSFNLSTSINKPHLLYSIKKIGQDTNGTKIQFQEIFLTDHRQWTSVRDNHMENINKVYTGASYRVNTSTPYHYKKNSLNNENCIMTDDIVNLDDDNEDAIEEAEKLLDQLDLLSSSES